ncbi:hypothetical protein Cgig2_008353 [Carnegiea gigantea]|uniref:LOB domain-containing protein n=1 Tax=Carnegiea gigantea TaxID=171969 RepID=A0A9Q1KAM0_9CARY|nr:hypothetical protein Cgig2_008353 [Carnegiea gigantea]
MHRTNGISGSHQACAACKHQRKKCTDKCILAPFFPAEKIREFQAVHKVFGVSNVQKMVKNLFNDEDRKRAADSLVWEALCRQKDPVLGPYGEYRKIYEELKFYQAQTQTNAQAQPQPQHQQAPLATQNGHNNGLVYKTGPGLIGWSINNNGSLGNNKVNGGGGIHENVALVDCIRAHCSPVMDSGVYGNYGSQNNLHIAEKMRQDGNGNIGSTVPAQQHVVNGFNQHYYLQEFTKK